MIITIGNIKGGVGKSCIAQNLAVILQKKHKKKVLLVDADPQETSAEWISERRDNKDLEDIRSIKLTGKIRDDLIDQEKLYDCVIVDCGGHQDNTMLHSIAASTHVLMPFRPKKRDLKTLPKVKELIDKVSVFNPDCIFKTVITQAPTHRGAKARIDNAKSSCKNYDISCLNNFISNREIYDDAEEMGSSIFEVVGYDSKAQKLAIEEFEQIANELLEEA